MLHWFGFIFSRTKWQLTSICLVCSCNILSKLNILTHHNLVDVVISNLDPIRSWRIQTKFTYRICHCSILWFNTWTWCYCCFLLFQETKLSTNTEYLEVGLFIFLRPCLIIIREAFNVRMPIILYKKSGPGTACK